jgi:hypothetical protein
VTLEPAADAAVAQQLLVADRTGGAVERVEERGGVALGEDQVVVREIFGVVEVVAQVPGE